MKHERSILYTRRSSSPKWGLFLLLLFVVPGMVSCGSSGGDVNLAGGGIGGTGYTSVGTITALGSIFVNGIEFETADATVTLSGAAANETDLQVGMVVKVEGTVNADGTTGKANLVAVDHNAEGPVNSIDLGTNTLNVMGQTVLVDAQTTIAGLPGNPAGLAGLVANDLVEISGLTDADGSIKATRIVRKSVGRQSQVSGRVSSLTSTTFKINTLTVDYSNAIISKFGALGINLGDCVSVRGNLTSPTTLLADLLEKKSPNFRNNDSIEIEGFIDSLVYSGQSISGFAVNTQFGLQTVELNPTTRFPGGQLDKIKVGARVKVRGTIGDNSIQAKQLDIL